MELQHIMASMKKVTDVAQLLSDQTEVMATSPTATPNYFVAVKNFIVTVLYGHSQPTPVWSATDKTADCHNFTSFGEHPHSTAEYYPARCQN